MRVSGNPGAYYVDAQGIGDTSLGTLFFKLLKYFNAPTLAAPFRGYKDFNDDRS